MNRKELKTFVIAVVGVIVFLMVTLVIIEALGGITNNSALSAWLNQPISHLKVWHLLLILYVTSIFSRD